MSDAPSLPGLEPVGELRELTVEELRALADACCLYVPGSTPGIESAEKKIRAALRVRQP